MKIGRDNLSVGTNSRVAKTQKPGGARTEVSSPQGTAAKVSISRSASTMRNLNEELAALPDVRPEKVNPIRDEVDGGRYHRSSQKVADKMIASSLVESAYRD